MKNMYFLISTFILAFFSFSASASHINGGSLSYRYIGDSTGVARQYLFELTLYRDVSGQGFAQIEIIKYCSSCGPSASFHVTAVGVPAPLPYLYDCVASFNNMSNLEYLVYQGVFTLPLDCADWKFEFNNCCRPTFLGNLLSANETVLSAYLNNSNHVQNESSKFGLNPLRYAAVNKKINVSFEVDNPDNDSLYYFLTTIKNDIDTGCGVPKSATYAMGFSYLQPIPVLANDILTIDSKTGLITVKPAQQGVYQISVGVAEYKQDTTYNLWYKAGETYHDVPFGVETNLTPVETVGIMWNVNDPRVTSSNALRNYVLQIDCADTLLDLPFFAAINCFSITPNGTGFRMLGPDNNPTPIIGATANCINTKSKNVFLKLGVPFTQNGIYRLYIKAGYDGKALSTYCGVPYVPADTLYIEVTGCSGVGLAEKHLAALNIFPNPSNDVVSFASNNTAFSANFELLDLHGKKLLAGYANQISVAQLPAGFYLLRIFDADAIATTFKILKE